MRPSSFVNGCDDGRSGEQDGGRAEPARRFAVSFAKDRRWSGRSGVEAWASRGARRQRRLAGRLAARQVFLWIRLGCVRLGVAVPRWLARSLSRIVVEAHPFTALDLYDSRVVDDYLDRAEVQSVDGREDLSRHLGRKTDALTAARRVGARGIEGVRPAGHVSRPIQSVAASVALRSGSIAIFPTSMTTIAGKYGRYRLMMQISVAYREGATH